MSSKMADKIKKTFNTGGSEFELNFRANRQFIKKPRRVICCYTVFYQIPRLKIVGLKMAKIQRLRTDGKT
jgi:hypothetical protein